MKQTIGFLSWLISAMAVISLTYSAFAEPLWPYLQGTMGGIIWTYRHLRNLVFDGLGALLSSLINFIAISWLPPAPWFSLPSAVADFLTFYMLVTTSLIRVLRSANRDFLIALIWPVYLYVSVKLLFDWRSISSVQDRPQGDILRLEDDDFKLLVDFKESEKKNLILWAMAVIATIFASMAFFALAYAENRIGF